MDDKILIKTSDGEKEVFMTFGLINSLVRIVGGVERVAAIPIDPDLADGVLIACLIPRGKNGRPSVDVESFEPPGLEIEEATKLFTFVQEHLFSFFLKALETAVKVSEGKADKIKAIVSSLNGTNG